MSDNNIYNTVKNFIEDHPYLFGDAEYKLIIAIYRRLDYTLNKSFVPLSETELMRYTGKKRQSIYSILKGMEQKGILRKLSGMTHRRLSFHCRERFYERKQYPLRSYHEKNIYDLEPLIVIVLFLSELEKLVENDIDFYEFLMKAIQRDGVRLLDRIFEELKAMNMEKYIKLYYDLKQQYREHAVTIDTVREEVVFIYKSMGRVDVENMEEFKIESDNSDNSTDNQSEQVAAGDHDDQEEITFSDKELFEFILADRIQRGDENPRLSAIDIMKDRIYKNFYKQMYTKYLKEKRRAKD